MNLAELVSHVRKNTLFDRSDFMVRFDECVRDMLSFIQSSGVNYRGCDVLDIGSGDGAIDLGMSISCDARVTGVDIDKTDKDALFQAARDHRINTVNQAHVNFFGSDDKLSSLADESFDHIYSRDVFEHVFDPVTLLRSAHRVLKPGGTMFIQIWPLWDSEWGAHLFPSSGVKEWEHMVKGRAQILENHEHPLIPLSYDSCSRVSLDDLQRACLAAKFRAIKVEMMTSAFSPPEYADHLPWNRVGISGVKVLLRK